MEVVGMMKVHLGRVYDGYALEVLQIKSLKKMKVESFGNHPGNRVSNKKAHTHQIKRLQWGVQPSTLYIEERGWSVLIAMVLDCFPCSEIDPFYAENAV